MRSYPAILMFVYLLTASTVASVPELGPSMTQGDRLPSLKSKLNSHIERFDSGGRPLIDSILELAYEYQVPMGLEYLDREAIRRPLAVKLQNKSVREVLAALVGEVPDYRVNFSSGIVEIYSPRARDTPSILLNTMIDKFEVENADAQETSAELFAVLAQKLNPRTAVFQSIAAGSLGSSKVTLRLEKVRIREILNTLVAMNGAAVWVVKVPPERLSKLQGDLWYIYSLNPVYKKVILHDLRNIFPP